jgi:ketosteroid isomerase-like protein
MSVPDLRRPSKQPSGARCFGFRWLLWLANAQTMFFTGKQAGVPMLLIAVSLAVSAPAGLAEQAALATDREQLIELSNEWMAALERQDRATLERFLRDDYYISGVGELKTVNRDEWLKNAIGMKWSGLRFHDVKVDVYGDVAVVTSRLDFRVTGPLGLPIRADTLAVDVWVRSGDQWRVAARHFGASSIDRQINIALGIVLGLALAALVWLLLRWKGERAKRL